MTPAYLNAYNQIKALENASVPLPLPAPTDAVLVGSIDAQTGAFTWSVPTFQQSINMSTGNSTARPLLQVAGGGELGATGLGEAGDGSGVSGTLGGGGTTGTTGGSGTIEPPTIITVGTVATNCVNLSLLFDVTNVQAIQEQTRVATAGTIGVISGETGSTGNVTISGFPTSGIQGSQIVLNAGLAASATEQTTSVLPAIETFPIGITVNGTLTYIHIAIIRPPVLGVGAFTIPAVPVAIVFSPPQGALAKNSNTFTDKVIFTTSMSTSVSTQTATKTAQAYSPADLAGKVGQLATQLGAVVAGVAAIGATGASSPSLINVISGPPGGGTLSGIETAGGGGSGSMSLGDVLKNYGASWDLVSSLISGLSPTENDSSTSTITSQTNTTVTLSVTMSDTYGSEAGAGPLNGDRFVYLQNVAAMWANVNGDVGISVLGYSGVGAYSGQTLLADLKTLESGGTQTTSGLDAATIKLLLALDPYYVLSQRSTVVSSLGPPLLGPPRFVPMDPPSVNAAGTASTGDVFTRANEQITDTSTTTTNQSVSVTDVKPGWIDVLFGTDNTETTTTVTLTNTVTTDQKTDETITNTVTMYSTGASDSYSIDFYYDNLFQTIVPVPSNSPVLQGVTIVGATGATSATATSVPGPG
jgi:hypothetical protein